MKQGGGDPDALRAADPAPASAALAAGTYTQTVHGHHSDVVVEVVLGEGSIDAVNILELISGKFR